MRLPLNPLEKFPADPILLVDDETSWLHSLAVNLEYFSRFNNIITCSDSREVIGLLRRQPISLVLLDLIMPHITGEDLLVQLGQEYPQLPVIVLSGLNQLETAVRCMKLGAFDYYVKTSEPDRLQAGIMRALQITALQRENRELTSRLLLQELRHPETFAPVVTRSPKMEGIFRYLEAVASSPNPVLFFGEPGTGKRLLARVLHSLATPAAPCIVAEVSGLKGEGFGQAFLGSDAAPGWFEQARDGVLIIEDVHLLSIDAQAHLTEILRQGEFFPVGGSTPKRLLCRLYCTSSADLNEMVDQCLFRRDLYFLLGTHQVRIPALRERLEDLPLLLEHFLAEVCAAVGSRRTRLPRSLVPLLATYAFPGNIKQLRRVLEQVVVAAAGGRLTIDSFRHRLEAESHATMAGHPGDRVDNQPATLIIPGRFPSLSEARELVIQEALRRANGNQTVATRLLGISQPALSIHLKKTSSSPR